MGIMINFVGVIGLGRFLRFVSFLGSCRPLFDGSDSFVDILALCHPEFAFW